MKELDSYQEASLKYRVKTATPEERVMGFLEEAGEVAGVFKRLIRGDYDEETAGAKLFKELGDCLWYLSNIASDNGWKLSDVAQTNLDKLESRHIRGTILGVGDDR